MKTRPKFSASHNFTTLPTTGEFITGPNGVLCPVLDVHAIDFTAAAWGKKRQATLVRKSEGGEIMGQKFEGGRETYDYITEPGDAVFVNSPDDLYVPTSKTGGRLKFNDMAANGYEIVSDDGTHANVKSPPAKLLVGVIDARVCIKNAWGSEGELSDHQFLSQGATLKLKTNGKVRGMDQKGFQKWELIAPNVLNYNR